MKPKIVKAELTDMEAILQLQYIALGMCFGAAFGSIIGMLTDNIGLWMPIGVSLGVAFGSLLPLMKKK